MEYTPAAAIRHLKRKDERLKAALPHLGPFTLELRPLRSTFEALLRPIVFQQLSGKAAGTIYGRLRALFPSSRALSAKHFLSLAPEQVRGAGLSRAKFLAATDLAERVSRRQLPSIAKLREMEDDAIVECLTEIRGIGRWTVEMLLIFGLGKRDVMPATDLGIRKGFARLYPHHADDKGLSAPDAILEHSARWQPYRSVASWYLWRAADSSELPD